MFRVVPKILHRFWKQTANIMNAYGENPSITTYAWIFPIGVINIHFYIISQTYANFFRVLYLKVS